VCARRARCWKLASFFHLKPEKPACSAKRKNPTGPTRREPVNLIVSRREEWQEQVKLSSLLDKWLDRASTFATATDPVAASALAAATGKKRGVKPGDHHRDEIAARAMQRIAADGARGIAAGTRRLVGMPLRERGDVGAAQIGREVSHHRPRGQHDRAPAAAQARAMGGTAP
jgi:hypothetical protein